jgi:hypothetical protein
MGRSIAQNDNRASLLFFSFFESLFELQVVLDFVRFLNKEVLDEGVQVSNVV